MTAKDYYNSTRTVETRNWTLGMALNFAEEYAEELRKRSITEQKEQLCDFLEWYDESMGIEDREMEVKTYMDMKSFNEKK